VTPTPLEVERRNRIRLSVAAYAYEYHDETLMTDHEFDKLSLLIDTSVSTGSPRLDNFFRNHFEPDTGMWIRKHPGLSGLERVYQLLKS